MPVDEPTCLVVAIMPDAVPNLSLGTEFMILLLVGAIKTP
jgi:hypothetical protein